VIAYTDEKLDVVKGSDIRTFQARAFITIISHFLKTEVLLLVEVRGRASASVRNGL
jgi:hypothetical protein